MWRSSSGTARETPMGEVSAAEASVVERAMAGPMLDQVLAWSAINSGSRNLPGLERMAATLADAFSALPGKLELIDAAPVESVDTSGKTIGLEHGQNLQLKVRPDAPMQLLFTGHMDTVFALDHAFPTRIGAADQVLRE